MSPGEADVLVHKLKDCPMLTPGRITPLVLQKWAIACARYAKFATVADDVIVSHVADAMVEPRLVSWYTGDRVRIDALKLDAYLKELAEYTLDRNWAHNIRQQILSSSQPDTTRFIDWKVDLENLNALLTTSSPKHALTSEALQNQLEANTRPKLNLSLENEPITTTPFVKWAQEVQSRDETIRAQERDIDTRLAARRLEKKLPLAQRLSSAPPNPGPSSTGKKYLPKLDDNERHLLDAHQGCRRCRKFYVAHSSDACPLKASGTWPDPATYTTLTADMAQAAKLGATSPPARLPVAATLHVGTGHPTVDNWYDEDTYVPPTSEPPFTVPHMYAPVDTTGPLLSEFPLPVQALLDIGCPSTVISGQLANQLGL